MLDADTKRRIDAARDILVGKAPDPKTQIEQITIALIYKFMDDMDAQSEEMGGKRSFFTGEYEQYSWAKLMRLSGQERLNRYSEAIAKMPDNPNLPPLFRSIFKDAFLPYRDPQTLRLFLNEINGFEYDHPERLGDAYEYLLSIMGSQGDAGQFRTPRHIIQFIVEVVDPKKDETILDPACGSAGFLIAAYKHILDANRDENALTSDEHQTLAENMRGYDIDPGMVKLALANMYLHSVADPRIDEYDTLTSDANWHEYADVILANPPFMTPKGGIRPHSRFSVASKRSEVLFVDYIADHLTSKGRAGVVVPEGIIFQSQNAYKQLRKSLVENSLIAVVSLPAGVFKPYSGVKTSILFLNKERAPQSDHIAFFKAEHDGFDLGDQRRPIDLNDLPDIAEALKEYLRLDDPNRFAQSWTEPSDSDAVDIAGAETETLASLLSGGTALFALKSKIAEDGEYSLTMDRYRETRRIASAYPIVKLGDVCEIKKGTSITRKQVTQGPYPVIASGESPSAFHNEANRTGETITVSASGNAGFVSYFDTPIFASDCSTIKPSDKRLLTKYIYLVLKDRQTDIYRLQVGSVQLHVYPKDLMRLQIPLPPMDIQREIVEEAEACQRVIDGAKAVLENYRPRIDIDPSWPLVPLGDITLNKPQYGSGARKVPFDNKIRYVRISDITDDGILKPDDPVSPSVIEPELFLKPYDLLVARSGSVGRTYMHNEQHGVFQYAGYLIRFQIDSKKACPEYVYYTTKSPIWNRWIINNSKVGTLNNINAKQYASFQIPLPPMDIQREIVSELDLERSLADGNRELIARMEAHIRAVVGRVWGD